MGEMEVSWSIEDSSQDAAESKMAEIVKAVVEQVKAETEATQAEAEAIVAEGEYMCALEELKEKLDATSVERELCTKLHDI